LIRIEIGSEIPSLKISLITGGAPHYELGLISGLVEHNVQLEVIGGDELEAAPIMRHGLICYRNLHGKITTGSFWLKVLHILGVYGRLTLNAVKTDASLLHVQWPWKFLFLDRTVLNLWYKALGKKVVFTAHNIDAAARDGNQSWVNRLSLRFLYRVVDHIIVHTRQMKEQLIQGFNVAPAKVSVIPHGIMSVVPRSNVDRFSSRRMLGIDGSRRVVVFFGLIAPYKGLEYIVSAIARLNRATNDGRITLVIAGRIKECPHYWERVYRLIQEEGLENDVRMELRHIPDESINAYFEAADVLVLPYRAIFQSGVLFLSFRFGLPVIATDVGSFREDIIDGQTGYICKVDDPDDLARKIEIYFKSDLFRYLAQTREKIRDHFSEQYSWSTVGKLTRDVYEAVLGKTGQ
jgi:D-inositol-3-phosphate glycosyltransferase